MSMEIHESVPVEIGGITLYCEKFSAWGTRTFTERNTVSGDGIITNSLKKAVRIRLSGRICDEKSPVGFIEVMNALSDSGIKFNTEYKNTVFENCQVQEFTVEDENNNFVSVSVTLTAEETSTKSEEDT